MRELPITMVLDGTVLEVVCRWKVVESLSCMPWLGGSRTPHAVPCYVRTAGIACHLD